MICEFEKRISIPFNYHGKFHFKLVENRRCDLCVCVCYILTLAHLHFLFTLRLVLLAIQINSLKVPFFSVVLMSDASVIFNEPAAH